MNDYISREAMLEKAEYDGNYRFVVPVEAIKGLPAADVEPVRHGRWEEYIHSRYCGIDEYGEPIYRDVIVYYCSNPKCRRKTVIKENYCPSCGRKMDLEDDNGT